MNEILWTAKALKEARKIKAEQERADLFDAVQVLKSFPDCGNVKALVDHEYQYRLRAGRYRVFFDFDGAVRIVHIQAVRKRDEHTY